MVYVKEPSGKAANENSEIFPCTTEEKCEDNPESKSQNNSNEENQSVQENSDVTSVPERKDNRLMENYENKEKILAKHAGGQESLYNTRTEISASPKLNSGLRILLPGQAIQGQLPSTSLTSRSFTKIQRPRIASQKFPCMIQTPRKNTKKVTN